jgi:hypothetical protein
MWQGSAASHSHSSRGEAARPALEHLVDPADWSKSQITIFVKYGCIYILKIYLDKTESLILRQRE